MKSNKWFRREARHEDHRFAARYNRMIAKREAREIADSPALEAHQSIVRDFYEYRALLVD
jgi:hypothetical protein